MIKLITYNIIFTLKDPIPIV